MRPWGGGRAPPSRARPTRPRSRGSRGPPRTLTPPLSGRASGVAPKHLTENETVPTRSARRRARARPPGRKSRGRRATDPSPPRSGGPAEAGAERTRNAAYRDSAAKPHWNPLVAIVPRMQAATPFWTLGATSRACARNPSRIRPPFAPPLSTSATYAAHPPRPALLSVPPPPARSPPPRLHRGPAPARAPRTPPAPASEPSPEVVGAPPAVHSVSRCGTFFTPSTERLCSLVTRAAQSSRQRATIRRLGRGTPHSPARPPPSPPPLAVPPSPPSRPLPFALPLLARPARGIAHAVTLFGCPRTSGRRPLIPIAAKTRV